MTWLSAMFGKESSLGAIAMIFSNSSFLHAISNMSIEAADSGAMGMALKTALTKPETLAFIFAFYFDMPCMMMLSATVHETRSLKWTLRVAAYYIGTCWHCISSGKANMVK